MLFSLVSFNKDLWEVEVSSEILNNLSQQTGAVRFAAI